MSSLSNDIVVNDITKLTRLKGHHFFDPDLDSI